jgi:predicted HTH transcriptional regulator
MSAADILSACERGAFEELKGAVETAEFEFKQYPYRLEEENQKREFAKDVSGLANAGGGVILLGATAAPQGPIPEYGEEIEEVRHSRQTCSTRNSIGIP